MKIIQRPHGQGKSTDLARFMTQPGNEDTVYIAPTAAQAISIGAVLLEQFGLTRKEATARVATGAGALEGLRGRDVRLVVDEVDGVLQMLLGHRVALAAFTPDEMKSRERGGEAL